MRTCPECGGYEPGIPPWALPVDARYCTPLTCPVWVFTARPDGRADLRPVSPSGKERP